MGRHLQRCDIRDRATKCIQQEPLEEETLRHGVSKVLRMEDSLCHLQAKVMGGHCCKGEMEALEKKAHRKDLSADPMAKSSFL